MLDQTKGVLQDLVAVVALVRTLSDSFGSASGLYRKLKKKSKNIKENIKEDIKDEIAEHRQSRRDSHSDDDRRRHWRSRSRSRRRDPSKDSDEESIDISSNLVRAEYDRGYQYVGEKYAIGDLITRNQLQSQIIALQQSLLYIYEDAIFNTGSSQYTPSFHLRRLVQTARAARSASIDALAMQYERMVPAPLALESRQPLALPGAYPASPIVRGESHELAIRKASSNTSRSIGGGSDSRSITNRPTTPKLLTGQRTSWRSDSSTTTRSARGTPATTSSRIADSAAGSLYCVYARDLQHNHALPLSDNFKPDGDNRCPYCQAHIPSRLNKAWEIVKEDENKKGADRIFLVGTRFMVKCHREGGGFACALCSEFRKADTVCAEVRALVEHLWKEHSCAELEWDENIGEERTSA